MEKAQSIEWAKAQAITLSVDLVEATKQHLKFLTVVDQHPYLYEAPALQRAVYRYNAFWIPLLAKHLENPVADQQPLVVPLDCEWIWHCHRLNPLRYKNDCETIYGRLLVNHNVISSVQATSKSKAKTEEIWNKMYPEEPYELDLNTPFLEDNELHKSSDDDDDAKFTCYDLAAASKRQMSFTFQICKAYTADDMYLEEALRRYKGFLHMVRMNDEKNRKCFCVPTYDIDLMWHTHQLYPHAYYKDMTENVGRVCHHNDKVSDRSPGKLLHVGFCAVTKLWEEDYGKSYWTAGNLHRGTPPTPVTQFPINFAAHSQDHTHTPIQFPTLKAVEVLLEFVEVKNLPAKHKGKTVVMSFSKTQPDKLLKAKRYLRISSEFGEKQVASFHCEPKGEFVFQLLSNELKPLGSYSLSLPELLTSGSQLSHDIWLPMEPLSANITTSDPILVHASISLTPPVPLPLVFRLATPKAQDSNTLTQVLELDGKQYFTLHTRNVEKDATKCSNDSMKEVYCTTDSGEKHKVAEFVGNQWFIKGSNGSLKLQNSSGKDDSLVELVGYKMVKVFPGRRLDFETIPFEKQILEQGFVTAVEFSSEYPYGKAIALINFKSQTIKATEEWMILPGITLTFLLSEILKQEIVCKAGNVGGTNLGIENNNKVTYGDYNDMAAASGDADLTNKIKTDGGPDCATCHLCTGHLAVDKFADCATCYADGVKTGDEENGGGGVEAENMVNYEIASGLGDADLSKKIKTDGGPDCATCHLCTGHLAADKFADCATCYEGGEQN